MTGTELEVLQDIAESLVAIKMGIYFIVGCIIGRIAARWANRDK